jgi:hypothetical protein
MLPRQFIWIVFLVLWASNAALAATPFNYQFDSGTNAATWASPDPNVQLKIVGPYLELNSTSPFPYIISPPLFFLAEEYDTLIIRMKCSKKDLATIFWATDFDQQFNANKSINFELGSPDRFHTYYINLKQQHLAWASKIVRLAISPFPGPGQAEIDYIRLDEENFWTNLLSGWQEFWGPKGRKTIGSTINVIKSTDFMGRPVNVYVYAALFILFIIFGIQAFPQISRAHPKPDYYRLWTNIGQKIFIAIIFAWVLLEISASYTYWNNTKEDAASYFGKSFEQKWAAFIGQPLYDFVSFAQKKLPAKNIKLALSAPDQISTLFDLKGRYYLYPLQLLAPADADQAEYVLIFETPDSPFRKNPKFTLFAKKKETQYILMRKQ